MKNIQWLNGRCIFVLFFIFLFSCRGTNDPVPLRSPELDGPVITGLAFTRPDGPEIVGVWRKPSLPEGPKGEPSESNSSGHILGQYVLNLAMPYPNPSNGSITIPFEFNRKMYINIWIVPVSFPGERADCINSISGIIKPAKGISVRTILQQQMDDPGYHHIFWDGKNDNGQDLPTGFYRIYIKGDNILLWRDVLLFGADNYISPELQHILKQMSSH